MFFLLVAVIIHCNYATAQTTDTLYVSEKNGKYGLSDKFGNVIIPYQYDNIRSNTEHGKYVYLKNRYAIIPVQKLGNWGIMNLNGEKVTPFRYDDILGWYYTPKGIRIFVCFNKKYGVIDSSGAVVIPLIYDGIDRYPEKSGSSLVYESNVYPIKNKAQWGVVGEDKKLLVPIAYDHFEQLSLNNKLRCVEKNHKIGYVDESWNEVIPFAYDGASYFFLDGYAIVGKKAQNTKKFSYNKFDTLTSSMEKISILEKQFERSRGIKGLVRSNIDSYKYSNGPVKWGVIDGVGNIIIPLEYDNIQALNHGYFITMLDGKFGFNSKGNWMCPTEMDIIRIDCFQKNEEEIQQDKLGKRHFYYNSLEEALAISGIRITNICVKSSSTKKIGLICLYEKEDGHVFEQRYVTCEFDTFEELFHNHYILSKNGKYGAIDFYGNVSVPFEKKSVYVVKEAIPDIVEFSKHDYVDDFYDMANKMFVHMGMKSNNNSQSIYQKRKGTENQSIIINWIDYKPTITKQMYDFEIAIKSDAKISAVKVYVNGEYLESYRALSVIPDDGYAFRKKYTVHLKEGKNTIRVEATNDIETVAEEKMVTYTKTVMKESGEKRIALVIGNNHYGKGNDLNNSINDARSVAAKLQTLGFSVNTAYDQNKQQMETSLSNFRAKAIGYDVALIYYAGHGMAIDNKNYLIPVGTNMNDEKVAKYNSIEVQMVLDILNESGCPLKMIFLDACRDNPFAQKRGHANGFGSMDAAEGTIIFFSTAIGKKASDGSVSDGHSPFATAFLRVLDIPNLSEDDFLKEVTTQVKTATGGSQFPFRTSAFTGSFIFNKK